MKNFVLDTNVILHDANCIDNFQDNNIYIPIVVLEELDKFKKGNEQINFNAREFIRELDKITNKSIFSKGISLGPGRGKLYILMSSNNNKDVTDNFSEKIADNKILSATMDLIQSHPKQKVILVTKDINLRMKARSLGIDAEDYYSDKVESAELYSEIQKDRYISDSSIIDSMYSQNAEYTTEELELEKPPFANECFNLKDDSSSILVRYNPFINKITKIVKLEASGIKPRNAEQAYAFEVLNDSEIKLVALTGTAGTGKTLLALAAALSQINRYKHILLMRPIVSLSNKEIGFLPGTEKEKIEPYMQPLFDNLSVIKYNSSAEWNKKIETLQEEGRLSIGALAYIRGRSFSETFCIIDEAQNLTPHEIKTIITRAGEGTKMVFTGDIQQIDSPYLDSESNGLAYMIDKMRNQPIFAHVNLVKGERSQLSEIASKLL